MPIDQGKRAAAKWRHTDRKWTRKDA